MLMKAVQTGLQLISVDLIEYFYRSGYFATMCFHYDAVVLELVGSPHRGDLKLRLYFVARIHWPLYNWIQLDLDWNP